MEEAKDTPVDIHWVMETLEGVGKGVLTVRLQCSRSVRPNEGKHKWYKDAPKGHPYVSWIFTT